MFNKSAISLQQSAMDLAALHPRRTGAAREHITDYRNAANVSGIPNSKFQILNCRYSVLSAFIGEMAAARAAGISAATRAQRPSDAAAIVSASGSQNGTPYSCAAISLPAPTASGSPSTRPIATRAERAAQHQVDDLAAIGAERHADADLVGPLRDGVRRDAVKADRREQQRDDAEQSGETRDRALLIERQRRPAAASSARWSSSGSDRLRRARWSAPVRARPAGDVGHQQHAAD